MTMIFQSMLLAAMVAGPAVAQEKATDHSGHHPTTAATAAANEADMTEGEVRKVDRDTGKLTIRHGEIKNLEMPPMTMVFQVKEPAVLDKVKAGDKVRFRAEKTPSGYVVTTVDSANLRR